MRSADLRRGRRRRGGGIVGLGLGRLCSRIRLEEGGRWVSFVGEGEEGRSEGKVERGE